MARYHDAPLYLGIVERGTNARVRLAILRKEAAQGSGNWRTARHFTMHNWPAAYGALSQGYNTKESHAWGRTTTTRTPVWYCNTGEQFRNERNAHDVQSAGITHKGWFADVDCSRTICGIVGSLTHGRFIAGTCDSDSGERVYFGKVFDDEREAARYADDCAQDAAEREQEQDQRYIEAQSLDLEIMDGWRNVRRMFALRNTSGFDSAADYRELEGAIAALRKAIDRRKTEYKDIEA